MLPATSASGGTQTGSGTNSGDVINAQPTSTIGAAVAPWTATNSQSDTGSSSDATADILRVDLSGLSGPGTANAADADGSSAPGTANADVLQSTSSAQWTPTQSSSSAATDAAIVDVDGPADLDVDAIHSEGGTTGTGSSYLASVNGTPIGTNQQLANECTVSHPGLLSLDCLSNSGGDASDPTDSSEVLAAQAGSGAVAPEASLFQAEGTPILKAASYTPPSVSNSEQARVAAASTAASNPAESSQASGASTSGTLPFTGSNLLALLALAMTVLVAGATIVVLSRRNVLPYLKTTGTRR